MFGYRTAYNRHTDTRPNRSFHTQSGRGRQKAATPVLFAPPLGIGAIDRGSGGDRRARWSGDGCASTVAQRIDAARVLGSIPRPGRGFPARGGVPGGQRRRTRTASVRHSPVGSPDRVWHSAALTCGGCFSPIFPVFFRVRRSSRRGGRAFSIASWWSRGTWMFHVEHRG